MICSYINDNFGHRIQVPKIYCHRPIKKFMEELFVVSANFDNGHSFNVNIVKYSMSGKHGLWR